MKTISRQNSLQSHNNMVYKLKSDVTFSSLMTIYISIERFENNKASMTFCRKTFHGMRHLDEYDIMSKETTCRNSVER